MPKKEYEYAIYVDNRVVWKGLNPKEKYDEIRKKYPNKRVSIAWEPGKMILVAPIQIRHTTKRNIRKS